MQSGLRLLIKKVGLTNIKTQRKKVDGAIIVKRFLSILLTFALTLSIGFVLTGCEQSSALAYELQSDGTYYVTELLEDTDKVIVPSKYQGKTVSGIAEDAFSSNKTIVEVVLPSSVNFIGGSAFRRCSNLVTINLSNITKLGSNALSETKLSSVKLDNVVTVGNSAFKDCKSLKTVTLSNYTTTIEKSAFSGCILLTNADIGKTKTIGDSAFNGCGNLVTIDLASVRYLNENCFMGCVNLPSVNLKNVIEVTKGTFDGCEKLASIYIGESAKLLHKSAFYGVSPQVEITLANTTGWCRWIQDGNNHNNHWNVATYTTEQLSDFASARSIIVPNSWGSAEYLKNGDYEWPR